MASGARDIAPHTEYAHIQCATWRALLALSQPTLGVSSLDLGRSTSSGPFFLTPRSSSREAVACCAATPLGRSAFLTYAAAWLLQCKKKSLQFVRRTARFAVARLAIASLASLPSLGVSSLDLGRSFSERPLFFLWPASTPFERHPERCGARVGTASRRGSRTPERRCSGGAFAVAEPIALQYNALARPTPTRPPRAARTAPARRRTRVRPSRPASAPAWRSPCSW